MAYRYKPSKAQREQYGQQMRAIEEFCKEHNIHQSFKGDSYYFELNGIPYRVSNHTIYASDSKAFDENGEQIRDFYHDADPINMVYITAGKTRIIDIYNDIVAGYELDKRGNRKEK